MRWSGAATSAEQMTAFARSWTKTSALSTLWRAIDFAEFLTILFAFAPATLFTRLMAFGALSLRQRKIVYVIVFIFVRRTGYDFCPVNGFDMADIKVIEKANRALQYIPQSGHFQRKHFGIGNKQRILISLNIQIE